MRRHQPVQGTNKPLRAWELSGLLGGAGLTSGSWAVAPGPASGPWSFPAEFFPTLYFLGAFFPVTSLHEDVSASEPPAVARTLHSCQL